MRRLLLLPIWFCVCISAYGQGIFENLTAVQFGDSILINWKLSGGNTCFDMHLERSDADSPFTPIYSVGGVCGGSDDQYYDHIDAEGLQSGVTYRYMVTASSGLYKSDTAVITYVNAGDRAIFIYPNPSSDLITVTIDNAFIPSFLVECTSLEGALISRTIQNKNLFTLDAKNIRAGNYVLKVTTTDGVVLTTVVSVLN